MDINLARKIIESGIKNHKTFFADAKIGFDYYQNNNDVLQSGAAAISEVNSYLKTLGKNPLRSADNRIPTNWHKILTDQKIGYLFTYPPQFDTGDDETADAIKLSLGEDYEKIIKQAGINASNSGRAWIHYWYNLGEVFEYWFIDPLEVVPIYDSSSVKKKLRYLLRFYSFVDEQGGNKTRYELWDEKEVAYLEKKDAEGAKIEFETLPSGEFNVMPHTYGEIPFIEFQNNATCTNDLKMYKRLIDAIDRLISGFANDIDDIQEILWVIKNYADEMSTIDYNEAGDEVERKIDIKQKMKAQKYLFVDDKGSVDALRNEVPYEARGRFLDILIEQLYISAMAVNPNPDKTGNQSGVYIEFLYSLLELKAGLMETEFRSSLNKLIQAVLKYLNKPKLEIKQIWTRNKPRNETEISAIIAQTPSNVMSDETKTKVHPLVEDWRAERKQIGKEIKEQEQNALDLYPPTDPPKEGDK